MNLICPQCNQPIRENDYNISTDIAYCRQCDTQYSVATLNALKAVNERTFDEFERSCCQELGRESTTVVSFNWICRLIGGALVLCIPIQSLFFVILYQTKPFEEILLFLMGFGISLVPDLLICIFCLAGKYVVTIEDGVLRVRTGIFPMRRSKQIDFDRTSSVHMEKNYLFQINTQPSEQIVVETGSKKITFGFLLSAKNKACLTKWLVRQMSQ